MSFYWFGIEKILPLNIYWSTSEYPSETLIWCTCVSEVSIFILSIGPEITDELVKVLRKRLDETTLDIITVMLVRNCKLTPADVDVG